MADNAGQRPRSGLGGVLVHGVNKVFRSWAIVEVYELHFITIRN